MKRIISLICIVAMTLSFSISSTLTAMASDFLEDNVIYGLGYYTGTLKAFESDSYLLVVPATGTIKVTGYSPENYDYWSGVKVRIISTETWKEVDHESIEGGTSERFPVKKIFKLNEGEYKVEIANACDREICTYGVKFDYNFDSSSRAKITSPGVGKIKITAPRGSKVDGFEVRYKQVGASNWKYKTIVGNKSLKTYLKNLKSGKKYYIQTRKFVTDNYDYKFYSNWTKKQSIKVK